MAEYSIIDYLRVRKIIKARVINYDRKYAISMLYVIAKYYNPCLAFFKVDTGEMEVLHCNNNIIP